MMTMMMYDCHHFINHCLYELCLLLNAVDWRHMVVHPMPNAGRRDGCLIVRCRQALLGSAHMAGRCPSSIDTWGGLCCCLEGEAASGGGGQ